MGNANLVDGQFGAQVILRPFSGFETVYGTGAVPGTTPLLFNEYVGGSTRDAYDAEAGQPGVSSKLVRGIAVPSGARVQVFLPSVLSQEQAGYTWQIVWRSRNPGDAEKRDGQIGWHFPKQANGAPETIATPLSRFVIPAAYESILYNQAEPTTDTGRATGNLRIETVSPRADTIPLPLLPDGSEGYYEQGIIDPGSTLPYAVYGGYPSYSTFYTNAKGDEMILGLYRDDAAWDFSIGGTDGLVSALFGSSAPTTNIGVYVSFGSSP